MSVTTTQNPTVYTIARTLADYELHHSQADQIAHDVSLNPRPELPSVERDDWETGYRRISPHRPIDYTLDFQSRNTTLNNIERFFLFNMFGGIMIVEVGFAVAKMAYLIAC